MKEEANETSSQRLYNHLYEACNILRGPINQDEYKSYIIPILFFKRLSDVYDEETQQALQESGGDEEYASLPEQHSFIIPPGCHWNDVREATVDVGAEIAHAMNGIERANPDRLAGVFSSFDDATWTDKAKLTDERLKDLVEHMSKINVGNNAFKADVMGQAYEYLLKKFADLSKKNAGEFYTPRPIVKLLIDMLDPQAGETVYDPACGTGGMLIEAIHHMHDDKLTYGRIFGQEKNLSTSSIARMNLFLHGASDFRIATGDTLRSPAFTDSGRLKTFNCVVANPPFSLEMWGSAAFETDPYGRNIWGCPTDANGDMAWLQHMVKSMDPKNGRVAVILPQGVLFRGNRDGQIRKQLVLSGLLDTVIKLPTGVFFRTGVNACVLFLKAKKDDSRKGKVLLIDGSAEFVHQRAQNIMTPENIQNVFDLYKNYSDVIDKSKVTTISDISKHDYDLSVNYYIEHTKIKERDPKEVEEEYMASLKKVKESEEKLKRLIEEGGYLDVK